MLVIILISSSWLPFALMSLRVSEPVNLGLEAGHCQAPWPPPHPSPLHEGGAELTQEPGCAVAARLPPTEARAYRRGSSSEWRRRPHRGWWQGRRSTRPQPQPLPPAWLGPSGEPDSRPLLAGQRPWPPRNNQDRGCALSPQTRPLSGAALV